MGTSPAKIPFERPAVGRLRGALARHPDLLHVVTGPRQVGKTTLAHAVAAGWQGPTTYAAADELLPPGPEWIQAQWEAARRLARNGPALLILDEVQKVAGWSEAVKAMADADRRHNVPVRVILLGSSALLLGRGTTESLAGRFLLHRCLHWSFAECRAAFGWDLDRWIFFGGYPGAAPLVGGLDTWRSYVRDSLIETVLARDVLSLERVNKPVLLRHLFALACRYPAQPLSWNKMLGQLTDAGNTTTLAHYVELLEAAFLLSGIETFSAGRGRSRGSSPKLVLWNNALVSALDLRSFEDARRDHGWWGRLVENAVGAHLLNHFQGMSYEVLWWRQRDDEVDYVVRGGSSVTAIEVKSGRPRGVSGLDAFRRRHPRARTMIVGPGGIPLEEFFGADPADLLRPGAP